MKRAALQIRDQAAAHLWHHNTRVSDYIESGPTIIVSGSGSTLTDDTGREYLDGTAILGVTAVGHGRREIAEAAYQQMQVLEFSALVGGFSHAPGARLSARLAALTPGDLSVSFFCSTGSEAVDTAIKIARQYHRNVGCPERYKIISRAGSYHGTTMGALSATGIPSLRARFEPLMPGFIHIDQPYQYRSSSATQSLRESSEHAANDLERCILREGAETIAAFIAEPIALPQAVKIPHPVYWERVQEICREYNVLLIADEVFVGFGRTGKLFASEHYDLLPDIMVVAKGITSGYLPLGAAIATTQVADAFRLPGSEFSHGGTYSGHPVCCTVADANLNIIERENLVENSRIRGNDLIAGLNQLKQFAFVGNVTGLGLLASVELVSDRASKAPPVPGLGDFILERMRNSGLLARFAYGSSIYFYPPLSITEEEIHRLVSITASSFRDAERAFS